MKETSSKMTGVAHQRCIPHLPLVSVEGCQESIPWTCRADLSEFGKGLLGKTLCSKIYVDLVWMLYNKTHLVRSCQFVLSEELVVLPGLTLCAMPSMSCEAVLLLEEVSQSVEAGHDSVNAGCASVTPERLFGVPSSFWLS